jgi:soluble lytic murein transglycosylase-like protein
LGAALSIGGVADAFDNVSFLVEKNLDTVQVVRQSGDEATVVASLGDGFAANTVFKLSRVLPDRYVRRELAIFDDAWLDEFRTQAGSQVSKVVREEKGILFNEMARINDAIRLEFFSSKIPFGELIHEKAEKYDVDPALVAAVIEQESRFKAGARGSAMPRRKKMSHIKIVLSDGNTNE